MSSSGARLTVLPCGGSPRSVQYSDPRGVVDFEVDRLGQVLEHHLDVAAVRCGFACGKVDPGPQDPAEPGVARTLLRPVEMPADVVDGDADAPSGLVAAVVVALPGLHQGLDVGPVEVAAHHPHALAVAPVQLAAGGVEMELLGGVRAAAGNDRGAVASVEVHTFDRAVVGRRHSHVGPVDVAGLDIDRDAIGDGASGDEDGLVGAVGVDGEQPSVAAGFEHEQLLVIQSSIGP